MDLTYYHMKSPYMKFGLEDDEFLNSLPAFGGDWPGACEPQPQQITNADVNTSMTSHGYGVPSIPQSSLAPTGTTAVWPIWPMCSRPEPALPASTDVSNTSHLQQSDIFNAWNASTASQFLNCFNELGPLEIGPQSTQQNNQQSQTAMACNAIPNLPWPWPRPHPAAAMIHLPPPRASMAGGCGPPCPPLLSLASSGVIRRREDCQLDMLLITDQLQQDQLLAEIEAAPWPNPMSAFHSSSGSCSNSNSTNTLASACVNALANAGSGTRFASVTSLGGVGPASAAGRVSNSAPATPALGLGIPNNPMPQPQNAAQELYPVATAPAAVAIPAPPSHIPSATAQGFEGHLTHAASAPSAMPLPSLPPAPSAPAAAAGPPIVDVGAINNYAVQSAAADAAGNACSAVPHFGSQQAVATQRATRLVGEDGRLLSSLLYDTGAAAALAPLGLSPALSGGAASSSASGYAATALPSGPNGWAAGNNNNNHPATVPAVNVPGAPAASPQKLNPGAAAAAAAAAAANTEPCAEDDDSDLSEDGALADSDTEAPRRPAAIGRGGRGGNGRVTLEELRPMFGLPVQQVVRALGISATDLKRRCRALGIQRWPQRKLLSLRRLAEAVEADQELSEDQRQETLARVARNRAEILANPDVELEAGLKPLRQVHYKRNFMDRRGSGRS